MSSGLTGSDDGSQTLIIVCPFCSFDEGETLGVVDRMWLKPSSSVVMKCDDCGTVSFSPVATPCKSFEFSTSPTAPSQRQLVRFLNRGNVGKSRVQLDGKQWSDALHDSITVLAESVPGGAPITQILIGNALELAPQPAEALVAALQKVEVNGRLVAWFHNVDSTCFRLFGGRHWAGYHTGRQLQFFGNQAIAKFGETAGVRLVKQESVFSCAMWLESVSDWLRDWNAPQGLITLVTGRWGLPWLLASFVEGVAHMRNRGALIFVELERIR